MHSMKIRSVSWKGRFCEQIEHNRRKDETQAPYIKLESLLPTHQQQPLPPTAIHSTNATAHALGRGLLRRPVILFRLCISGNRSVSASSLSVSTSKLGAKLQSATQAIVPPGGASIQFPTKTWIGRNGLLLRPFHWRLSVPCLKRTPDQPKDRKGMENPAKDTIYCWLQLT